MVADSRWDVVGCNHAAALSRTDCNIDMNMFRGKIRIILILGLLAGALCWGAWERWIGGEWHHSEVTVNLSPLLSAEDFHSELLRQLPKGCLLYTSDAADE